MVPTKKWPNSPPPSSCGQTTSFFVGNIFFLPNLNYANTQSESSGVMYSRSPGQCRAHKLISFIVLLHVLKASASNGSKTEVVASWPRLAVGPPPPKNNTFFGRPLRPNGHQFCIEKLFDLHETFLWFPWPWQLLFHVSYSIFKSHNVRPFSVWKRLIRAF